MKVEEQDILLNITGDSVARVCQVPKNVLPARVNQHVSIIRPIKDLLLPEYLLYYLLNLKFKRYMLMVASDGATRNALIKTDIEDFEIALPPIQTQSKISSVLSNIDKKIDLLHRQNQTLEQIARVIFKNWFINFEFPNKEGKPYKSSGGKMGPSELGKIPEGWEIGRISDIVDHYTKSLNPQNFPEELFNHYSIPAFDESGNPIVEEGKLILSNKYIVPENSILISKLNPTFPRVWLIEKQIDRRSICSTEFQVFLPNNDSEKDFFYGVCNTHYFKYEMMARATGTSSSHQRVRPEDILDISILLPVNDVLFNYHFVTVPIFNKRSVNKRQINYLTQLRDTLLPKLMSGEVRVRDKGIK